MGSPRRKPLVTPIETMGTINPEALKLPVLQSRSARMPFDIIAQLSEKAENLKERNVALKQRLSELVNDPECENQFTRFKRNEMEFRKRLQQRDAEIKKFARFLDSYRSNAEPTFVEIEAAKISPPKCDPITQSLLVSNNQRSFFKKETLEVQNEELKKLIEEQEEKLKLLQVRLNLYNSYQNQNTVEFTMTSLKKGDPPLTLAFSTPSKETELLTKKKTLKAELAALIKKRKVLVKKKIKQRNRRRRILSEQKALEQIDLYEEEKDNLDMVYLDKPEAEETQIKEEEKSNTRVEEEVNEVPKPEEKAEETPVINEEPKAQDEEKDEKKEEEESKETHEEENQEKQEGEAEAKAQEDQEGETETQEDKASEGEEAIVDEERSNLVEHNEEEQHVEFAHEEVHDDEEIRNNLPPPTFMKHIDTPHPPSRKDDEILEIPENDKEADIDDNLNDGTDRNNAEIQTGATEPTASD